MSASRRLQGIRSGVSRPAGLTRQTVRLRTRWRAWHAQRVLTQQRRMLSSRLSHDSTARLRAARRRVVAASDAWGTRSDLRLTSPARIGVVVHAFYAELLPDIVERVSRMPVDYDLWVTNASGRELDLAPAARRGRLRNLRVLDVENHGRDILPLLGLINAGCLDPYSVVLKIHTKRSGWRSEHPSLPGDGDGWREDLLDAVAGDTQDLRTILSAFAEQSRLGLVTADASVLGPSYWGRNQGQVAHLLSRAGVGFDPGSLRFAAGSIYWGRGVVLQRLRALGLRADDFEPEQGQVDATTAHAVERALGVLAQHAGFTVVGRSEIRVPVDSTGYLRL